MLGSLRYAEQQAMTQLKMEPEVYERQDYYRFNQILLAKSAAEREQDVGALFGAVGEDTPGALIN